MFIQIGNVSCRYEQAGQGENVLLLHGWGGSVESWIPVMKRLSATKRVTALDFPGHGQSGRPADEGWSVDEYAEFTAELMQKLDLKNCQIVAHSFGCRVAIVLASRYPQLVGRMVLTGAAGLIKPKSAGQKIRAFAGQCARAVCTPAMRDKLAKSFGSADYKNLDESMRHTFVKVVNQDLRPLLPSIRSSVILIWGRNDTETPLWFGEIMEKEIPDAGLVVLEGGHFVYLEQFEHFMRIVENFLKAGEA